MSMSNTTREIMARQASAIRAQFASATPSAPITLSPALFDKLRPEHRASYRRA